MYKKHKSKHFRFFKRILLKGSRNLSTVNAQGVSKWRCLTLLQRSVVNAVAFDGSTAQLWGEGQPHDSDVSGRCAQQGQLRRSAGN